MFSAQPLPQICEYFGEDTATYFAFIGYYTSFLGMYSIIGTIVFIYGVASHTHYTDDICSMDTIMCPICDRTCDFWTLNETLCSSTKFSHVFDNRATIIYSLLVPISFTLFLKLWGRHLVDLSFGWNSLKLSKDKHPIRIEYERKAGKRKVYNSVTYALEPKVSRTRLAYRRTVTFLTVIFFIALCIASLIAKIEKTKHIYTVVIMYQ